MAVRALPLRVPFAGPLSGGLVRALDLPDRARKGLPPGLLVELSRGPGAAATTAAVQIVLASQRAGDPAAWIQPEGGTLYPPDLAAAGVDLDGLIVVHVPPRAGRAGLPKAAELLLRSGAFGAIVVDVEGQAPPRGGAWLGRLGSLAREHACRCVFLTAPSEGSLGPLISLRLRAARRRVRPGRFVLETEVLKDKSGAHPTLPGPALHLGPAGLP
ncbi:MAG: recombinase A [Sandaracinaceae bacterium]|nr:recombinase A [Sandaracinaceae bacterium]